MTHDPVKGREWWTELFFSQCFLNCKLIITVNPLFNSLNGYGHFENSWKEHTWIIEPFQFCGVMVINCDVLTLFMFVSFLSSGHTNTSHNPFSPNVTCLFKATLFPFAKCKHVCSGGTQCLRAASNVRHGGIMSAVCMKGKMPSVSKSVSNPLIWLPDSCMTYGTKGKTIQPHTGIIPVTSS